MNPESWKRLEDRALWLLEHADQSPPSEHLRGMALQLRLWRYPRSGARESWSIILPVREYRERRAVVREVAWDRPADWKRTRARIKSPKVLDILTPSVRIRDAEMDWTALAPFLDAAGRLPMSTLGGPPHAPLEEDAFGLEGFRSLAHIRLEWSGRGPGGWRATTAWFGKFRRLLVQAMKHRDTEVRSE
jgi:hypothetical protein